MNSNQYPEPVQRTPIIDSVKELPREVVVHEQIGCISEEAREGPRSGCGGGGQNTL